MADTSIKGGLATDPSKVNLYGAREEDVAEYQKSLQDSINALQQRYAQPNWFNVAAGFFKPQLGGFAASLGSASEALGQNVEREREAQLPIAQMRSQLALSKINMGQNKTVSEMEAARIRDKLPITAEYAAKVINLAPDSPQAKAIQAQLSTQQKERELAAGEQSTRAAQYGQSITAINSKWQAGGFKTKADYAAALDAAEKAYGPGAGYKLPGSNADVESGEPLPTAKPKPDGTPPPAAGNVSPPPAANTATGTTSQPSSAAAGNTPRKFNTAISYGTPAKLLDNLMARESGGDAHILNPDTKAMGAYQFLPETAAFLNKNGIVFNPLDKNESRAAADWYLQDLLKKNGGDWNKAIAAYGGFKTKDPSAYINKVTAGVDFSKPVEQSSAPAAVTAKPPEKVVLHSPYESVQYDPEADKAEVEARNKQAREQFAQLSQVGSPNANKAMVTTADSLLSHIKNNKKLHDESFGLLQNKGDEPLWAQIKTGLNKGIQLALQNPVSANFSVALPVEAMERAGLDAAHRKYLQTTLNLYAKMAADQQRMYAVNPNAISNQEANLYGQLSPDKDTTADNAINMALHHREDIKALGDQWNFVNDVDQGRHPYVSIGKVPDRLYTIMHSEPYGQIYDPYIKKHAQINEAFQRTLSGRKKP